MKAVSVLGMVVGILFVAIALFNGMVDPYTVFVDQAIYLVGGALLFILSALLNLLISIRNSIDEISSNLNTSRNQKIYQRAPQRDSGSKFVETDFEGIPRKPGETGAAYWDRVEKETSRKN